jgi:actin related protein 2/3 complex subunit 5
MRVFQAFKATEIEAGIKVLDKTEVDVLMKYIYRGFAESTDNASAILLAWHDKVMFNKGLPSVFPDQY